MSSIRDFIGFLIISRFSESDCQSQKPLHFVTCSQFHFADQLPVYTTSQSKRGSYENQRVKSTELPLNLPETHVNSSGFASWSSLSDNNEVDFFALGQSALEIAGWAPLLYREQKWREFFFINSAIGGLQVDSSGQLSRSVTVQ